MNVKIKKGFTLVELLIASALVSLVFGGLLLAFSQTLKIINISKSELTATSLANNRMEYFKSLPYNQVGTVSGIPSGNIPQNSIITSNGIVFQERVLVEYVDDVADGQDTATTSDSNGISADYKKIKLEYFWNVGDGTSSISIFSNIVPRSIETNNGGGTVKVNVIDSNSSPVLGANVRLINNTTTTTIDVTKNTDSSGVTLFSGAPAASGYELLVTKSGYSTDKTYEATTTNPTPIVSNFSVVESSVSTLTFKIDKLSDINIATYSNWSEGEFLSEFNDWSQIASSSNIDIDNGDLVLQKNGSLYESSGFAYLNTITPVELLQWESLRLAGSIDIDNDFKIKLFTATNSSYVIIPDSDLPGNSTTGFSDSLLDLSNLSTSTYKNLVIGIFLNTSNQSVSPELNEIAVYYTKDKTILPTTDLSIRGNKIIGTDNSSSPIYKYQISTSTNNKGQLVLKNMEFDEYSIMPNSSYVISTACPAQPLNHQAGLNSVLEMELKSAVANSLRVSVTDDLGKFIPGADVYLTRPGFSDTKKTNICGQVFFDAGLSEGTDYQVRINIEGYNEVIINPFSINGDTVAQVNLN